VEYVRANTVLVTAGALESPLSDVQKCRGLWGEGVHARTRTDDDVPRDDRGALGDSGCRLNDLPDGLHAAFLYSFLQSSFLRENR
jgi:hypothetical protein